MDGTLDREWGAIVCVFFLTGGERLTQNRMLQTNVFILYIDDLF